MYLHLCLIQLVLCFYVHTHTHTLSLSLYSRSFSVSLQSPPSLSHTHRTEACSFSFLLFHAIAHLTLLLHLHFFLHVILFSHHCHRLILSLSIAIQADFSLIIPQLSQCELTFFFTPHSSPSSPAPAPSSSSSLMFISCLPFQKRRNLTTQGTGEKTCSCSELRRVQKKVADSTASQPFVWSQSSTRSHK